MAAAAAANSSTHRILIPPAFISVPTKPEEKYWKLLLKGDRDCPCRITMVRPRKISMPARVTINGGIFKKAMKHPWNTPISRPHTNVTITATGVGTLCSTIMNPRSAPETPTTEPTDRSTLPVRTQKNIPIDKKMM